MDNQIELGVFVADEVTGFRGIVTGKASYLTGCDQYLVQPKSKQAGEGNEADYTWVEGRWFDVNRLRFIRKELKLEDFQHDNGSDLEAPTK